MIVASTAVAVVGMAHPPPAPPWAANPPPVPATWNDRVDPAPKDPPAPAARVSTSRHGVIVANADPSAAEAGAAAPTRPSTAPSTTTTTAVARPRSHLLAPRTPSRPSCPLTADLPGRGLSAGP